MRTLLLCLLLIFFITTASAELINKWKHLKSLFDIVNVGGPRFHPYKNEMMFVSNKPEKGVYQIYTVKFSRNKAKCIGRPKRLINTKNRSTSPRYLRNGSILFLHDRDGTENFQIGYIHHTTKKLYWITNDYNTKNAINLVTDNYLYYTSNKRKRSKFDIYRRPRPLTEQHKSELLYTPKAGVANLNLVSRDETKLVINQHYSNVDSELLLLDLVDRKLVSLTKPLSDGKPTRWAALKWLNRAQTRMLVKTDYQHEFLRPAILEWPSGDLFKEKAKFITIPFFEELGHDVLSFKTNRRTGYTYAEYNKEGYSKLIRFRFEDGDVHDVKHIKLPIKRAVIQHGGARSFGRGFSISRDGNLAAVSVTNTETPADIWMINLNTGKKPHFWKLLKRSVLPKKLRRKKFVRGKLRSFKSFDGLRVPYFIYMPKGPMPENGWPTIIQLHGGPESQTRPDFSPLHQLLLASGYALVTPNIRGSRGYGKTYMALDNQSKRMNAIKDIVELAKHLHKTCEIDTSRLVIMGGSYGGYATLMAAVSFPDYWKAAVDIVGMSNLVTFLKNTSPWRRKLREPEYGSLETQRDMLEFLSPINYIDRIKAPVFIIQGDNDPRVPLSEAIAVYKKLKEVGKTNPIVAKSRLMRFADEGHGFTKKKNRLRAYHALRKWLNEVTQL